MAYAIPGKILVLVNITQTVMDIPIHMYEYYYDAFMGLHYQSKYHHSQRYGYYSPNFEYFTS